MIELNTYLWVGVMTLAAGVTVTIVWRGPLSPGALFGYFLFFKFVLRAWMLVTSIDPPDPAQYIGLFFAPYLEDVALATTIWLVSASIAFSTSRGLGDLVGMSFPVMPAKPRLDRLALVLVAISVPGAFSAFSALTAAGSVEEALVVVRIGGFFDNLEFIRKIPQTGVALSAIALSYVMLKWGETPPERRRQMLSFGVIAAGALLVNFGANVVFGDRSAIVLPILLLMAPALIGGRRVRFMMTALAGIVMLTVVLIILGEARSNVLRGDPVDARQQGSVASRITDGVNLDSFDRLMLVVRDWSGSDKLRWGEDFSTGVLGVVPRALWSNKPDQITVGGWFREHYTRRGGSGWPLAGWGEWFVNFGWPGVVVSGFIMGLILRGLTSRYVGGPPDPLSIGMMVVLTLFVFPTGVNAASALLFVLWIVPLHLVARGTRTVVARSPHVARPALEAVHTAPDDV